jgi:hypothetical protein
LGYWRHSILIILAGGEDKNMSPADVIQWGKALAIICGVLIGVYAVFSPARVWHTHQLFGWGGCALAGFGTILIVASLFQTVNFRMGSAVELKLAELERKVDATQKAAEASNRQISRVVASASEGPNNEAFAKLQKEMEKLGFRVEQIGQTSNAALSGVRNIDAKIQALPAVQKDERGSGGGGGSGPGIQNPFAPAR